MASYPNAAGLQFRRRVMLLVVAAYASACSPATSTPPVPPTRAMPLVVEIQDGDPAQANHVERRLKPVINELEKCAPSQGGIVTLKLSESRAGKLEAQFASSVDERTRSCVLEAISKLPLANEADRPLDSPSGFTSAVTLTW